ncbi:glutathione S-transferase family protein [Hyalangium versicolor]|uniref:glutathione S-transferase family protein n=1 Tax=Hyalangium versicolor TaxID=2861190 RepID=UPI001CCFCFF7|nr:glutathione S-transferase family protein [Hyalangium versicolor]
MKLYFNPLTRSTRPRWMLEELGVPYETASVDVMKGEQKHPAYMARVHPLGKVPALEDNGFMLIESAAIVMHLADKYPEKGLAPAAGSNERGEYYQWIFFVMTEAEPSLVTIFLNTQILPEDQRDPAAVAQATERFKPAATVLQERLKGREYIVGNTFTAADVVVGGVLTLAHRVSRLGDFPGLQAYMGRMMERPAAKKAFGG